MDVCLLVLKESNKSRFDIQLQFQEQCIEHIPYYLSGLSRAHFFRQQFLEIAVYKKKTLTNSSVLFAPVLVIKKCLAMNLDGRSISHIETGH